ncbi:MAG TPA: ABC transporter substrate-binding protein [Anaerolineales bacterium]|nr:ABC transporter substrate-binding protein [Anaerolineales bacterium]
MKTRLFMPIALVAVLSFVLAACGPAATQAPAAPEAPAAAEAPAAEAPSTELEGELSIVAWAGYVERGETDPNYDWVTQFEADTSCSVSVKTAATSDEMVALMNEGGFDLVTASGDASNRLIAGGTVQPIDISRIPSYSAIDERLQNAPWHTVDGVHYGVPYSSGENILMYNTDVFGDQPPTSWDVVFEEMTLPDGQSNKGRIQAYDGPIYVADAALYLASKRPELGITDPYSLTREQFDAALELLRQQRTLINRYWHDAFVQMDDFTNEGVAASGSWPFQANYLKYFSNQPIEKVVPVEGATGWADSTMLHVDSEHPNCAYAWMEWSLNPKVQGDLASWFSNVPVRLDACEGNELLGPDGCKLNGLDDFDKIYWWRTPTADCGDGRMECVPYHEWVTNYIAVIGGR